MSESGGSHIEPPLDQSWSELEKLQWRAAVVALDSGVEVSVHSAVFWIGDRKQEGTFDIRYGRGVESVGYLDTAWSFLNGVELGARLAKQ